MKKILLLFSLALLPFYGSSQVTVDSTGKMKNEQIILNINWLSWINYPSNIDIKPTSSEFTFSYLYPLFGKKNHFSMAVGLGSSTQNIKYNAYIAEINDKPTFFLFNDSIAYTKNKLTTVFIDIPIEFRLRTNNNVHLKNFKFSFGGKIGYLIKSYHKYSGDEYRFAMEKTVKFKEYKVPYLNKLHYGIFTKLFYGQFGLNVYYSLSDLFENNLTPEITPFSVGISMILI